MISIVIPLYNKEKSIIKTLESVCAQTYTDWECIIVNDGSTDKSADVVREWVGGKNEKVIGKNQFRVIDQKNAGVSAARNAGIREAKGEYIAFLDGDDLWESIYLAELDSLITDYPQAAIYGLGYANIVAGVRQFSQVQIEAEFRGVMLDVWENHDRIYWTSATACPTTLAKSTLFDETLTHGEDIDMWYRLMLQGESVFYNKTLVYYVQDSENRAMSKAPAIDKHIVSVIDKYAEARKSNAIFRKAFDTQMIYFLYQYLFTEYKSEAQRLARKLDYSQLKWSLKFRMQCPNIYKMYLEFKEK